MDGGTGNHVAGQASRQRAYRAALAALDSMPEGDDRAAWMRDWRGAHAMALDGLPGRLTARVRLLRAAIRLAEGTIRQAAERGQG
jgi:hypothetical protein